MEWWFLTRSLVWCCCGASSRRGAACHLLSSLWVALLSSSSFGLCFVNWPLSRPGDLSLLEAFVWCCFFLLNHLLVVLSSSSSRWCCVLSFCVRCCFGWSHVPILLWCGVACPLWWFWFTLLSAFWRCCFRWVGVFLLSPHCRVMVLLFPSSSLGMLLRPSPAAWRSCLPPPRPVRRVAVSSPFFWVVLLSPPPWDGAACFFFFST